MMEELRMALWSQLEDIDHSLTALEAVVRALAGSDSLADPKDLDGVMWHIAKSLQDIRADVDEAAGMTIQMKTAA